MFTAQGFITVCYPEIPTVDEEIQLLDAIINTINKLESKVKETHPNFFKEYKKLNKKRILEEYNETGIFNYALFYNGYHNKRSITIKHITRDEYGYYATIYIYFYSDTTNYLKYDEDEQSVTDDITNEVVYIELKEFIDGLIANNVEILNKAISYNCSVRRPDDLNHVCYYTIAGNDDNNLPNLRVDETYCKEINANW